MTGDDNDFEQLSMFGEIVKVEVKVETNEGAATTGDTAPAALDTPANATKPARAPALKNKAINKADEQPIKEKEKMQTADKGIDFEASLTKLEAVVKELDGEVKLEEALKLFEEGIKLSVECEKFIKSAEQKIEILKKQADGSTNAESFENETAKLLAGD